MKISWTSLKISIAGARLSHLVQKDKIWDHGSMAEHARILFYLVHKARANGNIDAFKRQCTISCFAKIKAGMETEQQNNLTDEKPVINELAIIGVSPGKKKRPDQFSALIKGYFNDIKSGYSEQNKFSELWSFIRQGDWWVLDKVT